MTSLFACLLQPFPALSRVVGEAGNTYPIAERDFAELVKSRLHALDWPKIEQEWRDKAQKDFETYRLPTAVSGLPPSPVNATRKVDPTYVLPYDIYGLDGQVIYPKGFAFNPLEMMAKRGLSYPFLLVIINADRPAELDWCAATFAGRLNVRILITDGSANAASDRFQRPVHYLTRELRQRLGVTHTPSLIHQVPGETSLTLTMFNLRKEDK